MKKLMTLILAVAMLAVPQLDAAWSGDLSVKELWNRVYDSATQSINVTGTMTMSAPVTAVTTGGDEIANEATLAAFAAAAATESTLAAFAAAAATEATLASLALEATQLLNEGYLDTMQSAFQQEGLTFPLTIIGVGGKDPAGDMRAVATGGNGVIATVYAFTGADNQANSNGGGLSFDANGAAKFPAMWQYYYDDNNWDRARGDTKGAWTQSKLDGTEWSATGAYVAAQNNTVIKACPAGKRLVLTGIFYSANGTILIQLEDEDDADVVIPTDCNGSGSGAVFLGAKDDPIWIGGTDKDLEVDTNAAIRHGVQLKGYVID